MQHEVDNDPLNVSYRAILASHMAHAEMYDKAISNTPKGERDRSGHGSPISTWAKPMRPLEGLETPSQRLNGASDAPWHAMPPGYSPVR